MPNIVFAEDKTFLFSTSADSYIKGNYEIDKETIVLSVIENQTNLNDKYIKDLTFQIKNSDTLVLSVELPEITTPSAEFTKVKEIETSSAIITGVTPSPLTEGISQANLTITGTVLDVSLSARIITLEQPVQGIQTVALTDETSILTQNEAKIDLTGIHPGMQIQATGKQRNSASLIASQVILQDQ
ncbi:MAG TPA: hypothetical protein DCK95_03620 [Anaerolineaceae bacterium]|nr:hypothetical protein [Anaerolineaceae bacterium]